MDSADLSRDTSGTRAFSQFVVELAEKQPSLVLPNISLLLCHLDGDVSFISVISFLSLHLWKARTVMEHRSDFYR